MTLTGDTKNNLEEKAERSVYEALTDWNNLVRNTAYPFSISSRKIKSKESWKDKLREFFSWFFKKKVKIEIRETDHSWVEYLNETRPTFTGAILPLVKQVSARTVASDLVSVQPMALPSGLLFYMDTNYNYEHEDVYNRVVLFEKYKPKSWHYDYEQYVSTRITAPIIINTAEEMKETFGEPYNFSK